MKSITIRFEDELKDKLDKASKEDSRSINSFVVIAVEEKIQRSKKLLHRADKG